MRLYIDACCIIYAIEGLPQFKDPVLKHITQVESLPDGLLITSRLSRLECRIKPLRDQQQNILGYYDDFFSRRPLVMAEISPGVIIAQQNCEPHTASKHPMPFIWRPQSKKKLMRS
jgi:hypothetical protein